jgi:two-component system, LytTR family, sensor kinase
VSTDERLSNRAVAAWMFVGATAVGLLLFGYKALDHYARGYAVPAHVPLIEELTAAYGAALLLVLIAPRLVRFPLDARAVIANLAGAAAFSILHTTFNWATRSAVFSLLGERYDYGRMPARFAMEAPMDLVVYASFATGLIAIRQRAIARRQRTDALRSDVKLVEAKLQHLRSQLDPHFLFNALNTVSSVMYDDPARADDVIEHLSELLRASLKSGDTREVPLRAELELVEHYFAVIRARFGDKVSVTVNVPDDLLDAQVPPLALQPLIENAVHHGRLADGQNARIEVRARHSGDQLELEVFDDGPGIPRGTATEVGIGLGALRERLQLLHGKHGTVTTLKRPDGFVVTARLPLQRAEGR